MGYVLPYQYFLNFQLTIHVLHIECNPWTKIANIIHKLKTRLELPLPWRTTDG